MRTRVLHDLTSRSANIRYLSRFLTPFALGQLLSSRPYGPIGMIRLTLVPATYPRSLRTTSTAGLAATYSTAS